MKNIRSFVVAIVCVLHCLSVNAQSRHKFEIRDGDFIYDGRPMALRVGEMHYARVPQPYWHHRLKMIKAMGLNAVATYVFWNYHETSPGVWDFSINADIV